MEQITKNFKLIGGALIIISCFLPFISVAFLGSLNGFSLFSGGILSILAILLILAGGAALIYVSVVKQDIELAPKFKLSYVAKLAAVVGGIAAFIGIITTPFVSVGFGVILEIIFAVAVLFEEKVIAAIKK
jgi:hypothetical protein